MACTEQNQQSDYYSYLKQISQLQELALQRLLDGREEFLPEVAELCEDIGNLYLNVADNIRARVMTGQRHPPVDLPECSGSSSHEPV